MACDGYEHHLHTNQQLLQSGPHLQAGKWQAEKKKAQQGSGKGGAAANKHRGSSCFSHCHRGVWRRLLRPLLLLRCVLVRLCARAWAYAGARADAHARARACACQSNNPNH